MAMGDENSSGDYTDSGGSGFGDNLSRYSQESQDYIRANSQTRFNGKPLEEANKKPNTGGAGGDQKASLGEKENNVGSDADNQSSSGKFKNAVQGIKDIKSGKLGKGKGKLKKSGPIMAIIALCAAVGGGSFFGQMAMPFRNCQSARVNPVPPNGIRMEGLKK